MRWAAHGKANEICSSYNYEYVAGSEQGVEQGGKAGI